MFHFPSCCSAALFQALQQHTDSVFQVNIASEYCSFSQQYCAIGKGQLDAVLTNRSTYIKHQSDIHAQCAMYHIYIPVVAFELWLHWDINIYTVNTSQRNSGKQT